MFLFWLKKSVSRVFFPVPLVLELLILGALLSVWKKSRRIGILLIASGTVLLVIMGTPAISRHFLIPLESRYRQLDVSGLDKAGSYTICVAGSAYEKKRGFCDDFLLRLQEAGRIAGELEKSGVGYRVVVSVNGDAVSKEAKLADLRRYFDSFGIPGEKVDFVDEAMNSRQEIAAFAMNGGRMILVSNAFHVPRLMLIAREHGVGAIPAPAGWKASEYSHFPLDFVPNADGLKYSEIAVYELLGMAEELL